MRKVKDTRFPDEFEIRIGKVLNRCNLLTVTEAGQRGQAGQARSGHGSEISYIQISPSLCSPIFLAINISVLCSLCVYLCTPVLQSKSLLRSARCIVSMDLSHNCLQ